MVDSILQEISQRWLEPFPGFEGFSGSTSGNDLVLGSVREEKIASFLHK
jgi:hypothetical protein